MADLWLRNVRVPGREAAIRTHVDVDLDNGITAVEDVLEAAARVADRLVVKRGVPVAGA